MSVAEEERIRTNVDRLTSLEGAVLLQASSTTLSLDRREQALAYLSRLLTIDPDLPEAHSRRAQLLMDLERYEEAIAGIDSYLRLAGLPFEHPYVRRAYELRRACEMAIE
jgi:tetratricopeptide (TPR) repeat protein